jgi:hypothetical protein
MMDYLGPESLMLYFALVLLALAATVRYFMLGQSEHIETAAPRSDYVMMDASSQAALQMDPRALPQDAE